MPEEPQTPPKTRSSIILQQVVSLCTVRSLWESDARGATDPSKDPQHRPAAGGVTVHREKLMGERCQRRHRPLQRPAAASSCSMWGHCAAGEAYGRAMPEEPQTPPETRSSIILQHVGSLCTGRSLWESDARGDTDPSRDPQQHHPAACGVTVHREKLMGERCQRSHRPLQRPAAASSCSMWGHCAPGEAYGRAMPEKPQTPPETRSSIVLQQVVSLCTRRGLWESDARGATDPPETRSSIILQQVVSLCTRRGLWESDARGATDPPETQQHHPAAGGVTVHREKLMGERCQRRHRPLQRPAAASSCSMWGHCAPGEAYGRAMPEKPQTPPETRSIILQQVVSLCTVRSLWESDARGATDPSRDPQHHPAAGGVTVHREKLMGERCQRSHTQRRLRVAEEGPVH
ncbi:uncharacterized protein [Engystomops pustulosus]|uniref:uncharacterized protein n=1 Tax=Engystomops pustulosus TaxID=76066 RepID=UPI003AFA5AB1